ncbi:MAG TPA: class I tRNA ligase family protein [Thermoplasmata archaeon]|nr:class I tRNA ligase family protein [Thermoplasmata archaeon]
MTLVFRESLTGRSRPLPRPVGRPLTMYVCGPTIYDRAHVGHGRNYLYFDLLRRYFRDRGQEVRHVMNITDYEDKISERAASLGLTWRELARREERRFLADFRRLGLLPPHEIPRASSFVGAMVRYAEALTRTGRTSWDGDELYYAPDPSTDARNFPVGRELSEHAVLEPNIPPPGEDSRARRVLLFRRQTPPAASWGSPWGRGAPGWTLECYAMAHRYLGVPVDLHGGGMDLIFPHHYSENAVSLTLDGHPFARRFLYTGFVTQGGHKMSKSVGNLVSLADALDRYGATAFRWYVLTPRYNARLEWDDDDAARAKVEVEEFRRRVRWTVEAGQGGTLRLSELDRLVARVLHRLEDGFGVDGVFEELRGWSDRIAHAPVPRFERGAASAARGKYRRLERLLGLDLTGPGGPE